MDVSNSSTITGTPCSNHNFVSNRQRSATAIPTISRVASKSSNCQITSNHNSSSIAIQIHKSSIKDDNAKSGISNNSTLANLNQPKHKHLGNYELLKTIGEGSFAKVKLAIHRLTNQKVAVKIIDKEKLPDEYSVRNLHREVEVMRLLNHRNIIKLYEVIETKRELNLVLEYASGGEILDYIVAHGRLKENEAKKFARQIVSALEHCHSLNVVHRDLKAENLLLDSDMNVKISDFGLSNLFDRVKVLSTFCGSPVYSAPELIEGKKYVGPEVDSWSLGINLYAMVVGDLPFSDNNLQALYESILKCKFELPNALSSECKDLIGHLLVLNPKKRYSISQVRDHPWITSGSALLEQCNTSNEHILSDADLDVEILEHLWSMGFEKKSAIESILENRYDQSAATYHLLLAQKNKDSKKFSDESEDRKKNFEKQQEEEIDELNQKIKMADRAKALDHANEDYARMMLKIEKEQNTTDERRIKSSVNSISSPLKKAKGKTSQVVSKISRIAPEKGVVINEKLQINSGKNIQRANSNQKINLKDLKYDEMSYNSRQNSANSITHSAARKKLTPISGAVLTRQPSGSTSNKPALSPAIHRKQSANTPGNSLPPILTAVPSEGWGSNTLRSHAGTFDIPSATEQHVLHETRNNKNSKRSGTGSASSKTDEIDSRERRKRSNTISVDESLYLTEENTKNEVSNSLTIPRTIRFAFNCSTTSSKHPKVLFEHLVETLRKNSV
ncbi:MAP microtubule affinity-regulating kinase 1, partial [Nowakowskiella sp. JEL0078]